MSDSKDGAGFEIEATSRWEPPPLRQSDPTQGPHHRTWSKAAALTSIPLHLFLWTTAYFVVLAYVPEVRSFQIVREFGRYLLPLTPNTFGWPTEAGWRLPQTLALLSSVLLVIIAGSRLRYSVLVVWGTATALALAALGSVLPEVSSGSWKWAPAAALAVIAIASAIRAALDLPETGEARADWLRPSIAYVIGLGITVVVPLGIGRRYFGGGVEQYLRPRWAESTLLPEYNVWTWAAGLSVVTLVWALIQLVPPYRNRRVLLPAGLLVAAVVILTMAGSRATAEASALLRLIGVVS